MATFPSNWKRSQSALKAIALLALLVFLAVAPAFLNNYRVFVLALIMTYALAVHGFQVLIGWSGQIGLAHAGFFGLGAYGTALMMTEFGLNFFLSAVVVGIVAAIGGAIVGWPAVQLRGFFLAIATLAFGELIVRGFAEARGLTGGGTGMSVPVFKVFDLNQTRSAYYLALGFAVVGFFLLQRLLAGRLGRMLKAVRDVEIATGPMGIHAPRYKLIAFSLSGFVAAQSGAVFGQLITFIFPDQFVTQLLVTLLVMLLVGGIGSSAGSVIGAIFGVVIVELFQDLGEQQRIAYAAALIIVVRFLPGGIASIPRRLRESRWFRSRRPVSTPSPATVPGGTAGTVGSKELR